MLIIGARRAAAAAHAARSFKKNGKPNDTESSGAPFSIVQVPSIVYNQDEPSPPLMPHNLQKNRKPKYTEGSGKDPSTAGKGRGKERNKKDEELDLTKNSANARRTI